MVTGPKTGTVSFNNEGQKIRAVLVLPGISGLQAAIIAVHECRGLNDWTKEQAKNLAANGCVVLAVDRFSARLHRRAPA